MKFLTKKFFASLSLALLLLSFQSPAVFAVADDYTYTGGAPASLPDVGAASVALPTITITDVGGDDFTNDPENIVVRTTGEFENVVFDTSVTTLTIGGTCGFDGHDALVYSTVVNSNDKVTIPITGPGSPETCANGETITISGLRVITIYASTINNNDLLFVDNSTTSSGSDISGATINLAVSEGALSSANVEPETLLVASTNSVTVSFVTTSALSAGSRVVVTFPSGFDVSAVNGATASNLSGLDGTWTASVSGQVVTLTQSGGSAISAGTKSLTLSNIVNPTSSGSTGTYTVATKYYGGGVSYYSAQTATAAADTIVGGSSSSDIGAVQNIVIEQTSSGVLIQWDPPSDDTAYIQILKGVSPTPVDGTPIATVDSQLGYYEDTDVEVGDELTYMLRGASSSNTGVLSDEYFITVSEEPTSEESNADSDSDSNASVDGSSETDSAESEDDSAEEELDGEENLAISVELSDIAGHWAENNIVEMVNSGVIQGNPDGTFLPDASLNRAEAAAMIYRLLGLGEPESSNESSFVDVSSSDWYSAYVESLNNLGVVEGNPDGTYEPSETINRAEFLVMAFRLYEYLNEEIEMEASHPFQDVMESDWFAEVVSIAYQMSFVEGSACEEGQCFNPGDNISRAEAATILYRMFVQ